MTHPETSTNGKKFTMFKLRLFLASIIAGGLITAPLLVPSAAHASPSAPTTGDTIRYEFCSDVHYNLGSNWFNGHSDQESFVTTALPTYQPGTGHWCGQKVVRALSTYQLVASGLQTGQYWAECRIYINGTLVDQDHATGRYAVVTCAA